jgi:hypothetical protein
MNGRFMATMADYIKGLDDLREATDETLPGTPHLGKIEVWDEGGLVGYLDDPDGLGYIYEPRKP